jgi:hypothetical protein
VDLLQTPHADGVAQLGGHGAGGGALAAARTPLIVVMQGTR